MTYLVDTDVLIDFLAAKEPAVRVFDTITDVDVAISVISVGEYYEGVYRSRNAAEAIKRFQALLDRIGVHEITDIIMMRYAWLRTLLLGSGQIIGDFDIIIAATAIHHDLTLVTRNRKHFERIDGLKLYEWDQVPR